ncbi:MAG: PfkB family carbohydrate kinase [Maritimibacter sp.]
MSKSVDIWCIGSVLWDIVGRADANYGSVRDVPGRIRRIPGGVAMNIAMTLLRFDLTPGLLSAVGQDPDGDELVRAAKAMKMHTEYLLRDAHLPTDIYMAIEDPRGLVAALADAHSLEAAGDRILAPLEDGRLGSAKTPYEGRLALDGNLTEHLLEEIATRASFGRADLRVAPASPGKCTRLRPLLAHPNTTFYVNLEEARLILEGDFQDAAMAAAALVTAGAARAFVTDGPQAASFADRAQRFTARPPSVTCLRVTGAGDTCMAAHIAAEARGLGPEAALIAAQTAAARYVAGEDAN